MGVPGILTAPWQLALHNKHTDPLWMSPFKRANMYHTCMRVPSPSQYTHLWDEPRGAPWG